MATETATSRDNHTSEPLIARLRRRRVTRHFTDKPVTRAQVRLILEGGRWASSASNQYIHRFVVVDEPSLVALVKQFAPGILGNPTTLIVICTDLNRCQEQGIRPHLDRTRYIDVGTAAMNMLLMAQDLGLGACPITSFSQRAVARVLDLPAELVPELMVILGHPAPADRTTHTGNRTHLSVGDLSFAATAQSGLQRFTVESEPD